MAKLPDTFTLDSHRGYMHWAGAFNAARNAELKRYPGVFWDNDAKAWAVPLDVVPFISWLSLPATKPVKLNVQINKKLHAYQQEAVLAATTNRRYILSFEMGLGKTPTTIDTLRVNAAKRTLVICPAIVRDVWRAEMAKWWPQNAQEKKFGGPQVNVIEGRKQILLAHEPGMVVVSYELAPLIAQLGIEWDSLVLDEAHYVKNPGAKRSKEIEKLINKLPKSALVLFLTGTPILSEPADLYNQLHLLYPGRFGHNIWSFARAYAQLDVNQYGTRIKGVNADRADELATRLKPLMSRVTKHEVSHLLPPLIVQQIRVKNLRRKEWNQREIAESLSSGIRKQHELGAMVQRAGAGKFDTCLNLVAEAVDNRISHVCIATHHKETALTYAEYFEGEGLNVLHIDGDVPVPKRVRAINAAKEQEDCVLVGTMHSMNVGIDLTRWTVVVLAELYWQMAALEQFFGRFQRLNGKDTATIYVPVLEGSLDEPIAGVLRRRTKDASKLMKASMAAAGLAEGVNARMTDEEYAAELAVVAQDWLENQDGYL